MTSRPKTPDEELIGAQHGVVASEITDAMRVERMADELTMGFRELSDVHRGVSVFGSARTPPGSDEYRLGVEVGRRLGEAGAHSIGLNIDLPFEQGGASEWVDQSLDFHYFFCRKVMFVRYANAFVVLPGGLGTLDELFEALCLIQTQKIRLFPVVLVGVAYWEGLVAWLRERVAAEGKIDDLDLERLFVTDDLDAVVERVQRAAVEQDA